MDNVPSSPASAYMRASCDHQTWKRAMATSKAAKVPTLRPAARVPRL